MRTGISVGLCLGVLVLGLRAACRAAENRARGAELDRLQRWCETYSRQNELLESLLAEREAELLQLLSRERALGGPAVPAVEVSW